MNFNKLVRDKIPEILKNKGSVIETYICDDQEYAERLKAKLQEEVEEFLQDDTPEELADILEVVYALAKFKKLSEASLNTLRDEKLQKRGAFDKKIVLTKATKVEL